jgi:hypothetical protein
VCVAPTKHGYFIYDDLLNLPPGGWQGGFVPRSSPFHAPNLASLSEQVPVFILELSDEMGKEKKGEGEGGGEGEGEGPTRVRGRKSAHGMHLRPL